MKPKRTYYYSDALSDDFADHNIEPEIIGDDFVYVNNKKWWKTLSSLLYRGIATPVAWFNCRVIHGVRIKNRKAVKKIQGGFFMYGNHTQSAHDAFAPSIVSFPRKNYVVTSPEAVSIPFLKQIVMMLGAIPMPGSLKASRNFLCALKNRIEKGNVITIYPEAHIWPYYTGIRPFPSDSFSYPARLGVPVIAFAITYRANRIFKNSRPNITIHISDPIYPNKQKSIRDARDELREKVYDFMVEKTQDKNNAEYIRYTPVEEIKTNAAEH